MNRRGRWRVRQQVVDTYISPTLPYPDACVASALCGPAGACKYVIKGEYALSDELLVEIAAKSTSVLGSQVARVLSKALVWATFEDNEVTSSLMPRRLRDDIRLKLQQQNLTFKDNPIERIAMQPSGTGADLRFLELRTSPGEEAGFSHVRDETAILAQQFAILRRMEELSATLTADIARLRGDVLRKIGIVEASVKRIALQPVVRRAKASTNSTKPVHGPVVRLSKCPRNLYILWQEYEFGFGGRKPAREFTSEERGANKFAYSRRKVFWELVDKLTRRGYTSDVAIDKIYSVYGRNLPVSTILLKLRQDRRRGGNPAILECFR